MLYREVSKVLGKYLFFFSFILLIPLFVSLYYEFILESHYQHSSLEFFLTMLFSFALSFLFWFIGRKAKGIFYRKESILSVVLIWLISCFIAGMPFYLTKTLENPIDAYFEAMSGFTTTGASTICPKEYNNKGQEILIKLTNPHVPNKTYEYYGTVKPIYNPKTHRLVHSGIEAVGKGLLFWRSFIQWLGGMGIVVLFLAILPALSIGGKFLYQMEVPGPTKDTVAPRIKETASILWKLYIFLTFLQIILLIWTNDKMTLYDACCITFSTLSGGGFSVKNASIGAYNNAYTDWVVICFMIAGGINFALYFHIMKRRFYRIFDPDLMLYLFILLFGSLLVSSFLIGKPYINLDNTEGVYSIGKAIRYGFFQAISAQTSTGFATTNYDIWPFPPQMFMLLLMYIGGMSGSTAGGIKTSRYLIAFKVITHKIKAICHPEEVSKIRIQNSEITTPVSVMVLVFFSIAIFFAVLGMALLVLLGIDPETAIGAIACLMNNIGMAFRAAGPANSFAFFPNSAKIVSIIWMLLGRLEFFAVILVLIPSFWKKNK